MGMVRRLFRRGVPSWGLAMLVREPTALVLANLAWHLAAGAREVHLFLDDPDDPVHDAAAALPGVTVTRCDAAFWAATGRGRSGRNNVRQSVAMDLAYARAGRDGGVDWLLHLDADEFLVQRRPLADELAALPQATDALVLPVRERAYLTTDPQTLFEGVFRIPQTGPARAHPLLQPNAAFCPGGLSGHVLGKSLSRTGRALSISPHFPSAAPGHPRAEVTKTYARGSVVLHFDGLTPRNWLMKFLRYDRVLGVEPGKAIGGHRRAQLAEVVARRDDPAAMLAFHDRIKLCPDPAAWMRAGLVEAVAFDPLPALRQHLPSLPDLSVAAFDAETRLAEPDLMRGL
jgi:hypothetical protein